MSDHTSQESHDHQVVVVPTGDGSDPLDPLVPDVPDVPVVAHAIPVTALASTMARSPLLISAFIAHPP